MAQFEWRPSEIAFDASNGEVDVRIPDCGGPGAEWVLANVTDDDQGDEDDDGNAAVESKPVSRITAKGSLEDAYKALDDAERKWLDELAGSITDWVTEGKPEEALAELDAAIPYIPRPNTKDGEFKAALQHLLPTNVMKAIKEQRSINQPKKAA